MAQLRPYGGTLEDAEMIARCNMMMAAAGLAAKAQTADDVLAICSSTSVFVAAFEQLTGRRIQGVVRSPKSTADRTENCRRVVQGTARLFQLDLSHLNPQRIVAGDPHQTASLLELIVAIPKQKPVYAALHTEPGNTSVFQQSQTTSGQKQSRRLREGNGYGSGESSSGRDSEELEPAREQSQDSTTGSNSSVSGSAGELHTRSAGNAQARPKRQPNRHRKHVLLQDSRLRAGSVRGSELEASGYAGTEADASENEAASREKSESSISESFAGEFGRTARFQPPTVAPSFWRSLSPARARFRTTAGTFRHTRAPAGVAGQQADVRLEHVTSAGPGEKDWPGAGRDAAVGTRNGDVGTRTHDVSTGTQDVSTRARAANRRQSAVSTGQGDVSTGQADASARSKGDVSEVLSLVARVGREEEQEWARKQAVFAAQLARMGRRAYASRWPFRPLPDLQNVRRVARQRPGVRDWVRAEEQRLQKRKKRLVPLRPRGSGRGVGAVGLACCRKAYRRFLPAGQMPPETEPKPAAPANLADPNRLFSKETIKQLGDVMHSPVSILDAPRGETPKLQTLLQKHPELRTLLVGPRGEIDGRSLREVFEELPLNPGAKKGLAEKVAGLDAMKRESGVRVKAEEVNQEKTWRHVESWAEGIVPKTEPTMRALAQARLRGRLESHQQKRRQIQAERFKEEVAKDQKAAAVNRAEAEERLFKTLLEKAVALEKEAILAQRKEAREQLAAEQRNKQAEMERAEAEVRARCALLKEEIQAKRREREEIERAQQQVMRQLAREQRERLELERAMLLERLALRPT